MLPPIFTLSSLDPLLKGWPPPVLDPAGPYAGSIAVLSWVLFAMAVAVFAVVIAALWVALLGGPATRRKLGGQKVIWIGGVAFPLVVLTALLVYGLTLTSSLNAPAPAGAMRVQVTGEMWWWRVAYLDEQGKVAHWDANELHIPVGRTVEIELRSADVIHSFWVPRLSGKLDMVPGRVNVMKISADEPGTYGGQCAEYCGGPHALPLLRPETARAGAEQNCSPRQDARLATGSQGPRITDWPDRTSPMWAPAGPWARASYPTIAVP